MKRARNKKPSIFSKKEKQPAPVQNDFEMIEEEIEEAFIPEEIPDDEPNEFAVPDEILAEALVEREPSEAPLSEAEMEAEEFAVPEAELNEAIEEGETDVYDDIPDDEVPFSTEDFTAKEPEEYIETEVVASLEEVPDPRTQNRIAWERKRRRKRIITVFVSVFLLFIVTSFALLGIDFSSGTSEDFLTPVDTATGKINVLLLGVDKDGERSDSIMLVSYDFDTHAINLMSIPRDTKMYVTDRGVTRKITEVHGMHDSSGQMYGAAAVAESVTALTGVPINYYLEFSFSAIDNVMDILGPVTFDVPDIEGGGRGMNYDDGLQDLHIHLKPGLQELSGNQIQQFLRYRKSNYGTSDGSDTSRMGRQQELLKAIIDQKINISFILKVPEIFKEMKSQLKTNFTLKDVLKYAGYLKDISSDNMTTHVLPGESKLSGAWYHICNFTQTAELVTNSFGYEVTADELTNEISLTGKKTSGKTNSQKTESDKKSNTSKTDADKPAKAEKKEEAEKPSSSKTNEETTAPSNKADSEGESKSDSPEIDSSGNSNDNDSSSSSTDSTNNEPGESGSNSSEGSSGNSEDEVISLD